MHSRWMAYGWLALALGVLGCDVGDAICTDATVEQDRNDRCPYGPPGGPQRDETTKCLVSYSASGCDVTFAGDVYPILTGVGSCDAAGCHGEDGSGSSDIVIPDGLTPSDLYDVLANHTNKDGDPYIQPFSSGQSNAYFQCNLLAEPGGGSQMPPQGLSPEDEAIIKKWVRCGMNNDGELDETGGAGGAGGGGQGGSN